MRVRQYADFGFSSETVDAASITEMMGVEPDRVSVRGSRAVAPQPLPRFHLWTLKSALSAPASVDDVFGALMDRIRPLETEIRQVLRHPDVSAGISVVRHFEEGPEDEAVVEPTRVVGDLVRMTGQHPLLGFHLSVEAMQFAAALNVAIDFDEYGPE